MEEWRFDKEWIKDQWKIYMKDKPKDSKISILDFTSNCIDKVKKYKGDLK